MAASDDFDALAAVAFEFGEQGKLFVGREFVARRVGYDGHAACASDPSDRVFERGPAVFHIAGFAFGQVFAKHLGGFFADAGFHQIAGKVGAGDEVGVACVGQRAFKGTLDTDTLQVFGHVQGPLSAPAAGLLQACGQRRVVRVKAQSDDVHGLVQKSHRNFDAGQVAHAASLGCGCCARLAADFVVVGQCPEFHAIGAGTLGKFFGGEGSV